MNYASFGRRFLAALLDGFVLMAVNVVLRRMPIINIGYYGLSMFIGWAYAVYFIGTSGQTLGKMALGIKVVKADGSKITWVDAIARETLGKIVSGVLLGLGYLWMLWDGKKQTFHDKIASTVVLKI